MYDSMMHVDSFVFAAACSFLYKYSLDTIIMYIASCRQHLRSPSPASCSSVPRPASMDCDSLLYIMCRCAHEYCTYRQRQACIHTSIHERMRACMLAYVRMHKYRTHWIRQTNFTHIPKRNVPVAVHMYSYMIFACVHPCARMDGSLLVCGSLSELCSPLGRRKMQKAMANAAHFGLDSYRCL